MIQDPLTNCRVNADPVSPSVLANCKHQVSKQSDDNIPSNSQTKKSDTYEGSSSESPKKLKIDDLSKEESFRKSFENYEKCLKSENIKEIVKAYTELPYWDVEFTKLRIPVYKLQDLQVGISDPELLKNFTLYIQDSRISNKRSFNSLYDRLERAANADIKKQTLRFMSSKPSIDYIRLLQLHGYLYPTNKCFTCCMTFKDHIERLTHMHCEHTQEDNLEKFKEILKIKAECQGSYQVDNKIHSQSLDDIKKQISVVSKSKISVKKGINIRRKSITSEKAKKSPKKKEISTCPSQKVVQNEKNILEVQNKISNSTEPLGAIDNKLHGHSQNKVIHPGNQNEVESNTKKSIKKVRRNVPTCSNGCPPVCKKSKCNKEEIDKGSICSLPKVKIKKINTLDVPTESFKPAGTNTPTGSQTNFTRETKTEDIPAIDIENELLNYRVYNTKERNHELESVETDSGFDQISKAHSLSTVADEHELSDNTASTTLKPHQVDTPKPEDITPVVTSETKDTNILEKLSIVITHRDFPFVKLNQEHFELFEKIFHEEIDCFDEFSPKFKTIRLQSQIGVIIIIAADQISKKWFCDRILLFSDLLSSMVN